MHDRIPAIEAIPAFARFLICGGIAATVNWSSRFVWSLFLPFGAAVLAAYVTGMAVAFQLFRKYVFDTAEKPASVQLRRFVLVNLIGMLATWAVAQFLYLLLFPLTGMTFHPEAISHGIAVLAPVITSWCGHRMLTFR